MTPAVQNAMGEHRRQGEARRIASASYPFICCVVCGLGLRSCMTVAHLDHQPGNNDPDNLAWLCPTHHGMYDCGLYPLEAIKLMRSHWQQTKGVACHKARMKMAGAKAATTRKRTATATKGMGHAAPLEQGAIAVSGQRSRRVRRPSPDGSA